MLLRRHGLALVLLPLSFGCSRTMTTVKTITPAEQQAHSWTGHVLAEVQTAWGDSALDESDGLGGHVLTYRSTKSHTGVPTMAHPPGLEAPVVGEDRIDKAVPSSNEATELAKFWIGSNGKVYRFWFAPEVYQQGLDSPSARPVERYGSK
jgi:hypothetical protein